MAFKHAYSVWSMLAALNLSTMFFNALISPIPQRFLSDVSRSGCSPAAASKVLISTGKFHCAMLSINNSLQPSSSKIAWSRKGRSKNVGMLRTHFTVMNRMRTADSCSISGVLRNMIGYGTCWPCCGVCGGVIAVATETGTGTSLGLSGSPYPTRNELLCSTGNLGELFL